MSPKLNRDRFACGVSSMTHCIEKSSPTSCATAKATAANGAGKDVITWQQHHAVYSIDVPDFTLSTMAGCGISVLVSVTVQALRATRSSWIR
jgi:hypothetical protein